MTNSDQTESVNSDTNQAQNLTDFELNNYINRYYANTLSVLTPYSIACLLIAFSPAIAKHIKNTLQIDAAEIQQELQETLNEFLSNERNSVVFGMEYVGNEEDEEEFGLDYSAMLKPESDLQRLLACFKQNKRDIIQFDDELIEYCDPILQKHDITFQSLFPVEFEQFKKNFVFSFTKSDKKTEQKKDIDIGNDLTAKVANLNAMPVFNRDTEIKILENLLLKQNRSNVMLVGKNGTGKTVLVEGLAYNIVKGLSHPLLRNTKIISVNFGSLMSDTSLRGQLEKKLTNLMDKISENNWILFLDEAHTLFSGGGRDDNIGDIMKPYLADGKVRVIAATTDKEFMNIRDGALLRRFNKINISEPTPQMTLDILKKLKPTYENNYSISIPDDVLTDVVKKTEKYVHNRNFPDKAIDLLNYACVLACGNKKSMVCDSDSVNKALMDIFNIPLELLTTSESAKFMTLKDKLNSKVFGQEPAIESVSTTLTHSYVMNTNKGGTPQASFLFCGPSGVGKTKTAEEIAALLGRGFAAINMNEYQNDMDVQKLTGAAPGYVGYESGGQLTNIIAENPYSVILFDEFEKAHRNVQRLLLQILDKGTFTDNQGIQQNFSNTIIVMATNAGIQKKTSVGFNEKKDAALTVSRDALAKAFLPEFLGRVNKIVSFEPLKDSALTQIVNTLCYELNASMQQNYNISVSVTPAVQEHVIKKGYRPELGARIIKNTFLQEVEIPVACEITKNQNMLNIAKKKQKMLVDFVNGKVVCKVRKR